MSLMFILLAAAFFVFVGYLAYSLWVYNFFHPLQNIAGPPLKGFFDMQLNPVLTWAKFLLHL